MYYTFGYDEIIKNISKAVNYIYKDDFIYDKHAQQAYCDFLNVTSIFETKLNPDEIILVDFNNFKNLAPTFCQKKSDFFKENSQLLKDRLSNGFFNTVLKTLQTKNSELYDLIKFIIKAILINQLNSYTNGTTAETIGLASMDFKDEFTQNDFIELVMHQLAHMLLFIDNYTNTHVRSTQKEHMIETNLKYKLGGKHFPAYLAFHSFIVGVEVLAFRKEITGFDYIGNYHGTTKRIFKVCNEFKFSLLKNQNLFTHRGNIILNKAIALLSLLENQYIN